MVKIKLTGHDYRYEVFQILSLFYDKTELEFVSPAEDCEVESLLNDDEGAALCRIYSGKEIIKEQRFEFIYGNTKDIKNKLKLSLLEALKELTGKEIPWGILVGIRPTKLVHDMMEKGTAEGDILNKLVNDYHLNREKADLTLEVAHKEAPLLVKNQRDVSLYIGIPFCPTRCVYCSFTSNPIGKNGQLVEEYLGALIKEIRASVKEIINRGLNIDTLYIGGGTPTSLSAPQMKELLDSLAEYIDLRKLREFTIEAGRPDSIDRDKLFVIKNSGCSRISINPQTMNDPTLKRIGRNHTVADTIDKFKMAREIGFDVINMDLIIGLPGEGIEEVRRTIEGVGKLSPENVTIHTLAIKRASILNEKEYYDKSNLAREMYELADKGVRAMGLYPYYMYRQKNMVSPLENVGYCTEGTECIYNVQMIAENISIISMGADAVTKLIFDRENRIERVANLKDVREYVSRIDEIIENKLNAIKLIDEYYR